MTCLIKTVAELLEVPGTTINTDTHIRLLGSEISFPRKKQEELCGNIVFCYAGSNGRGQWQVPIKTNTWTIEPWMIKEVLVE